MVLSEMESFSEEELVKIGFEQHKQGNINEAKICFKIIFQKNPLNFWNLLNYTQILIDGDHENIEEELTPCRDMLLKINNANPHLQNETKSNIQFFKLLAESCYILGPKSYSESFYALLCRDVSHHTYYYRYAELLSEKNADFNQIIQSLKIGVYVDPGKYQIRDIINQKIDGFKKISPEEIKEIADAGFRFTNGWFQGNITTWDTYIPQANPRKIIEIGSYEGQSICYYINRLANDTELEIHSVDTWEGGIEHKRTNTNMKSVENRFDYNIALASKGKKNVTVIKHKGFSDDVLAQLLSTHKNSFDLAYIDGSHEAPDVLCDAVLAFRLLKNGGLLGFDDYLFMQGAIPERQLLECPKPAIDAFVNLYFRKLGFVPLVNWQAWFTKHSN
jgi:predicted O-methyltransferase YrrM